MRNGKIRIIALTVAVVIMGALCGFRLMEYQIQRFCKKQETIGLMRFLFQNPLLMNFSPEKTMKLPE